MARKIRRTIIRSFLVSENVEIDASLLCQLHYMSQPGERNKRVLHSTKARRIPLKPNFVPVLHLKTIQRSHDP